MLFLLLPSTSPIWPVSALLGICANVGFGASVVAMNAYLPTLARASEEVVARFAQLHAAQNTDESTSATNIGRGSPNRTEDPSAPLLSANDLLEDHGAHEASPQTATLTAAYNTALSRTTSRISSQGIALGYTAGIILLFVALIPVTLMHGTTFALRLAIGLSGVWWALFSIPSALWLPSGSESAPTTHRDAEWEADISDEQDSKEWSTAREIIKAWKRLGGMLRWREIKRLRYTFQYLAAWFLLSDGTSGKLQTCRTLSPFHDLYTCTGFTTITSTAILFAKTSLHMSASALIVIGIVTPVSGIVGSLVWPIAQRRFGWTNLRVLVTLVCLASVVPAYGCLGFLSVLRDGSRDPR